MALTDASDTSPRIIAPARLFVHPFILEMEIFLSKKKMERKIHKPSAAVLQYVLAINQWHAHSTDRLVHVGND
jgi:hypothetical protein